jgi:hypothetical protein
MKIEAQARLKAASTKVCGCVTASCEHDAALTEKQKKLDINQDGKIDGDDLKKVREGELVEAATPQEAAKFVVKVFNKNGFRIKFMEDDSSDTTLVFVLATLSGKKEGFSLQLEGNKVTVTSGSPMVQPERAFDAYLPKAPFRRFLNVPLDSKALAAWESSTDKLAADAVNIIQKYQRLVERFNTAISEITAEMQKGKK